MQTTRLKHIALLVDYCAKNGVSEVVISPGSRNAPLIIAFEAHPQINTHLVHDERSAGFFALGLAESSGKPVALTCTSGSALLNYSPALVEAYYRQIPLLVLSADRPEHLIDQGDGQTMRQPNVYSNFIKSSYVYPEDWDSNLEKAKEICIEGITQLYEQPVGPVHINIPLNEPLYEVDQFETDEIALISSLKDPNVQPDWDELQGIWESADKKLILVGQHATDHQLSNVLIALASDPSIAVLVENTSNVQDFSKIVHCIDRTLAAIKEDELSNFAPDLLISVGGAVISKRIKAYFRSHKAKHTWRVGHYPIQEDTFQSLTKSIKIEPALFLEHFANLQLPPNSNFGGMWKQRDLEAQEKHIAYLDQADYSDLKVFDQILDSIPDHAILHMGNSSVVRYCQLFDPVRGTTYHSNRGVSGIDGSSSTAAGFSVHQKDKLNVLLSGDISFFYDSNAFWNPELRDNLKVIVISNGGGGIFEFIPGPPESEHAKTFFAPTTASVEGICKTYNLNYYNASSEQDIAQTIEKFFSHEENKRPSVLEISTQNQDNAGILKAYFASLV